MNTKYWDLLGGAIMPYNYTRKYYNSLQNSNPRHVIILEGEYNYWTYDDSANMLAKALNTETYKNASDKIGLTFAKDIIGNVESQLKKRNISYLIDNAGRITEYTSNQADIVCVDIGSTVSLRTNTGIETYIIKSAGVPHMRWIVDQNGNVEFQEYSEPWSEAFSFLSTDAPLGELLLGKVAGETVEYHGAVYTIEKVS